MNRIKSTSNQIESDLSRIACSNGNSAEGELIQTRLSSCRQPNMQWSMKY